MTNKNRQFKVQIEVGVPFQQGKNQADFKLDEDEKESPNCLLVRFRPSNPMLGIANLLIKIAL